MGLLLQECACPVFTHEPDELQSDTGEYSVRALMSLAAVLLTYHGARFARAVFRWLRCCWPGLTATGDASEVEGGAPTPDEEEQEKLTRAVNRAMEARRLERVRSANRVMSNVFPTFLCLQTAFYSDYLWGDITFVEARDLWRQVFPPMVYGTIVSTVWQAAPWLVTPRQVDIVHALGYIFWFLCGTLYKDNEYEFVYSATWITCTRTICAVILGNSNLVSVLSGSLAVANVTFLYLSFDFDLFFYHTVRELWAFATIVVLCKLVESSLLAEVRSAVEARNSSQAETTVHSLLSAMCDAVVHIGQDLCIHRPAPRLALLLLMQRTLKHLKGSKFTDLMAEADKERFCQVAADRETPTRSLNVHLRDEYGSLVGVRLFLARCPPGEDGETCQLVGVSVDEEAGVNHVPERLDEHAVLPQMQQVPMQRAHSLAGRSRSCRSNRSRSRRSNCSSLSDESLPLHSAAANEVAVWIDPDEVGLTVLSCTAGFTVVCGPASPGQFSLLNAIANKDIFKSWFHHSYNAKFYHDLYGAELDGEEEPPEPLDMILLPQGSCQNAIGLRATCALSAVVEEEEQVKVKLNFHNVSEVSRPRKNAEPNRRRRLRDAVASELPRVNQSTTAASFVGIAL